MKRLLFMIGLAGCGGAEFSSAGLSAIDPTSDAVADGGGRLGEVALEAGEAETNISIGREAALEARADAGGPEADTIDSAVSEEASAPDTGSLSCSPERGSCAADRDCCLGLCQTAVQMFPNHCFCVQPQFACAADRDCCSGACLWNGAVHYCQ